MSPTSRRWPRAPPWSPRRNAGAREVLDGGEYGLLADDTELGQALLRALESPDLRATLAEAGLERAQLYAWPRVIESYERLYLELLQRHRNRRNDDHSPCAETAATPDSGNPNVTTEGGNDNVETLEQLGERSGSDKLTHGYLSFYEDLFAAIRARPIRLLEIGVGGFEQPDDPSFGGHSLRMWRDFFPDAQIVGLDILDKSGVAGDRIDDRSRKPNGPFAAALHLRDLRPIRRHHRRRQPHPRPRPRELRGPLPRFSLRAGSTASKTPRPRTGPGGVGRSGAAAAGPPWPS